MATTDVEDGKFIPGDKDNEERSGFVMTTNQNKREKRKQAENGEKGKQVEMGMTTEHENDGK